MKIEGAEGSPTSFGGRACYWEPTWRGLAQSSEDAAERLVPAARRRASPLSSPEPASRPSGWLIAGSREKHARIIPQRGQGRHGGKKHVRRVGDVVAFCFCRSLSCRKWRFRSCGRQLILQDIVLWKLSLWKLSLWKLSLWKLSLWKLSLWKLSLWRPAPATPRGGYSASSRIRPRPPRVAGRGGGRDYAAYRPVAGEPVHYPGAASGGLEIVKPHG